MAQGIAQVYASLQDTQASTNTFTELIFLTHLTAPTVPTLRKQQLTTLVSVHCPAYSRIRGDTLGTYYDSINNIMDNNNIDLIINFALKTKRLLKKEENDDAGVTQNLYCLHPLPLRQDSIGNGIILTLAATHTPSHLYDSIVLVTVSSSLQQPHTPSHHTSTTSPSLQPNPPSLFTHPHPRRLVCTKPGTIPLRDNPHVDLGPGSLLYSVQSYRTIFALVAKFYIPHHSNSFLKRNFPINGTHI